MRSRWLLGAGIAAIVVLVAGTSVWQRHAAVQLWRDEELSVEMAPSWRLPWAPEAWIVAQDDEGGVDWRVPIEQLGAREPVVGAELVVVFAIDADSRRVTHALDRRVGSEVWRATQDSKRDLTTYGEVAGLIVGDALIEAYSRPPFVRVLDLSDGSTRASEVLPRPNATGALELVAGPTGALVFGTLHEGPSQLHLVEPSGLVTRIGKPGATSSCASITGVVSLDGDGWLFERSWHAETWSRRVRVGPGTLHGCVSNGGGTLIVWEAAEQGRDRPAPEEVLEEDLPLDSGCALLALIQGQAARGVAFRLGWLRLPGIETQVAETSSLAALTDVVGVSWTSLHRGEHDEPTTTFYRYDVSRNEVTEGGL